MKPDPQKCRLFKGGGVVYWNVRVVAAGKIEAAADVDAGVAPQDSASAAVEGGNTPIDKRARGGRPLHRNLYEFVRELVRLADLDNLPSEQGALYRHMRQWSDENFPEGGPSESTIRSWLAEFDHRRHQTPQSG